MGGGSSNGEFNEWRIYEEGGKEGGDSMEGVYKSEGDNE